MQKCRSGFSLVETLVALLLVSLAAMLVVRSSAANAVALAQAVKKSGAIRLTSEFSAWTHRSGHLALGMPLGEALAEVDARSICCDAGDCNAEDAAWHYLSHWRERLSREIPDARITVCVDEIPSLPDAGWPCDPHGHSWVLKLGWPPRSDIAPFVIVELGAV